MLRRLVEQALAFRLAVIGIALALAGWGGWSFANLPIDAFPDISSTQVKIILKAPGMTPEEVESRVITPIEMEEMICDFVFRIRTITSSSIRSPFFVLLKLFRLQNS